MSFPLDPDKVAEELSKRGKAWAELNAAYQALDDATKSVLSDIAGKQNDGSEASKERAARASQEYRDHLHALAEARTKAAIARVNYDVFQVWIDMKRSEASYTKAEMGLGR
jgi:ElaB/YqjD/DUF883 family membrane-anchored ribosome-binding protein